MSLTPRRNSQDYCLNPPSLLLGSPWGASLRLFPEWGRKGESNLVAPANDQSELLEAGNRSNGSAVLWVGACCCCALGPDACLVFSSSWFLCRRLGLVLPPGGTTPIWGLVSRTPRCLSALRGTGRAGVAWVKARDCGVLRGVSPGQPPLKKPTVALKVKRGCNL